MRPPRLSLAVAFAAALTGAPLGASLAEASPQAILSIVTSGDTEAQAMALILANEARGAGHTVSVLLCGQAGDIARKDAPEAAGRPVTPKGMSVSMLLAGLMKRGGTVEVCAIYLPNRKLEAGALIEGIGVASPTAVAARMADPAVKVVGN